MLSFNVEKLTSSAKLTPFEHMGTASYYHNQGTGKSQLCFLSAICSAAPISWTRALLQQFKVMMMMEAAMAAAEAERKQAALAEKLTTSNKCSTAAEPRPHQSSQSSSTFHRERLLHAQKRHSHISRPAAAPKKTSSIGSNTVDKQRAIKSRLFVSMFRVRVA